VKFGIHTGPQHVSFEDLVRAWRIADENPFEWCSVWDHFYPAASDVRGPCLEAVSIMTALACHTKRVRVGCLVYCVPYRHPAVLAKAAATIDHVSGGRLELGLGCGWHQVEADAYGIPFGTVRERLDQLEEGVKIIRSLFENETTTFEGKHYRVVDARFEPKPLQKRPRFWIGGMGEKRLLRIVAQYADAWNTPFIPPDLYAWKNKVLSEWCEKLGRDPRTVLRTVNVGLSMAANEEKAKAKRNELAQAFGDFFPAVEPGILMGTPEQVIDRIGEYREAGAEWIIFALRAPFDWESLEVVIDRVMPAFGAVRS